MTKEAKIKLGILGGIILLVLVVPFLIFGGGGGKKTAPQITLQFWNLYDDKDLYAGLIEEFQSIQPGVTIQYKKYSDINEYESDFVNALAEGKGPDIVAIQPSWIKKHIGKLTPMPQGVFTKADPDSFKSIFVKTAADDLIVNTQEGPKVYALPISMETLGTVYNRDLLLERISKDTPAETWSAFIDDLLSIASTDRKKTQLFRVGMPIGRLDNITRGLEILNVMMLQQGVQFYDPTGLTVTLAQPTLYSGRYLYPANEALNLFTSFATPGNDNYMWDTSLTKEYPEDKELGAFARGEIPMFFGFTYQLKDLESIIAKYQRDGLDVISMDEVGVAPFPQLEAATTTNSKVTLANYYPLAVTKSSKNSLAAWDFINFLTGEEQQRFLFNKGHKVSARINLIAEQSKDALYGAFAKQEIYAKTIYIPQEDKLRTAYEDLVSAVLAGRQDPTEGLNSLNELWQCYYDAVLGKGQADQCGK